MLLGREGVGPWACNVAALRRTDIAAAAAVAAAAWGDAAWL